MSAYPNFWAPQQTTNQYQNAGQPMQNPYIDRMNQMQQYQQNMQIQQPQFQMQSPQPPGISGRVVNDFSEITASDVPMNGSAAFFPKSDGAEIQVRAWSPNGTIQTVIYRPVFEQNGSEGTNTPQMDFNALNEDVRALREDIKDVREMLEKSMSKTSTRAKKAEASADE